MITLSGSVLWLFLLVYLVFGQLSDISNLDTLNVELDKTERAIKESNVQGNKDGNKNTTRQLETTEKNETSDTKQEELLIDKTTESKNLSEKPQDINETDSSKININNNKSRRTTQRVANPSDVTEFPLMSPERRNSYLSIAERRKYYNRSRVATTKKPSSIELDLKYQEVTSKLVTSSTETLQTNEIHVSKKPVVKDSNRAVTEKKNETNNQRVLGDDTLARLQSTRQSVIQSQYQFGQKLKPTKRPQDSQDERFHLKQEKNRIESIMENSTNKLIKNFSTQSTKLIRVDKNIWPTTTIPESDVDVENFVMRPNRNATEVKKLMEYVTINSSQPEVFSNEPISISIIDNETTEISNETNVPQPLNETFIPLPLSYANTTYLNKSEISDTSFSQTNSTETVTLNETLHLLPLQINSSLTAKAVEVTTVNTTTTEIAVTIRNSSTITTQTPSTILKILLNTTEKVKSIESTTPFYGRNVKFTNDVGATFPSRDSTILKSNIKGLVKDGIQSTTPLVRVIPKGIFTSDVIFKNRVSHDNAANQGMSVAKMLQNLSKKKTSAHPSSSTPAESSSSTEEYPLTIELNENNKRVLSEMFHTSTPSEAFRSGSETEASATSKLTEKEQPKEPSQSTTASLTVSMTMSTTTTTTTTTTTMTTTVMASTTTSESFQVLPSDEFPEDDYNAQGTQYNTKFYIAPNLNRTQVIRVVENEDDEIEDNEIGLRSRSVGIAIYVLASFGLIPLLLALVFGARFMVQRHQRQYECESDAKSDISTNGSQTRTGRKNKGSTDLKKSPSNVTTTTLVTTTRLPRVQHWECSEKQGSKNWEFPRSKLKLKTILGQGNFGQVWKAEAEDMPGHEGVTRLVAVKTVKEGATEREHAEFIKELEIMQQIGSHSNIVTLLGCCTDQEPYYLIMEYVKYGKLLTYLREHRINENYYNFSNNPDALTSRDLTVFAYCVARGMEYLASRGIIHRDLAARNVLVDHTKLCKIADFGMSRSVRDFEGGQVYEERQHKGALPIRWMAPESLVYSVFTFKSDVWSFGIVMWEIVTLGSTPYPNMGAREVMRRVRDGYRLERPSHCKSEFYRLISHCWAHDPNKRPDFSELKHELSNLLDNPTKDGSYVDLDRFAIDNNFHISSKSNDLRLLERNEFKTLQRFGDWDTEDWHEDAKKSRIKKGRNNGKGTVTLTGQGSFTVNSRILEKEFKMI